MVFIVEYSFKIFNLVLSVFNILNGDYYLFFYYMFNNVKYIY